MLQQLDAPVEQIPFARLQFRGALVLASGSERVPLLLVFIGERVVRVRAQRRSLFRQAFGGMINRIGAVAAALVDGSVMPATMNAGWSKNCACAGGPSVRSSFFVSPAARGNGPASATPGLLSPACSV